MAADSDGCTIQTVVTCEGDLTDPDFPQQFEHKLKTLRGILGDKLKVHKLEPWNSVRVTLSIPREAALRLRQLASEGSQQLRALGILSVQVEGDQVISLRLAGSVATEPQEIILRTTQDGSGTSSSGADSGLSRLLSGGTAPANTAVPTEKVQFRSPNVVCPPDTIVPKVPISNVANNVTPPSTKAYPGPFPFASMNQAIHSRDSLSASSSYNTPPPPYPGKHPPVTLSSPLLVNLLQNEGTSVPKQQVEQENSVMASCSASFVQANGSTNAGIKPSVPAYGQGAHSIRPPSIRPPPPAFVQKTIPTPSVRPSVLPPPPSQNSILNPSVPSPAVHVSTNTSISQTNPILSSNKLQTNSTQINSVISQTKLSVSNINTAITQPNVLPSNATIPQCNSLNPSIRQNNILPNNVNSNVITSNNNTLSSVLSNRAPTTSLLSTSLMNNNTIVQRSLLTTTPVISQPNNMAKKIIPPVRNTVQYRPCPPPYPSNQWETQTAPQLLELTPSLTDLKADDLDQLLPTLERELASSPPNLPEELTSTTDSRNLLINPLTGELEPQSSSESENEEPSDVFTDLPSPAAISDEDTNSTIRPDTTDQSDSETRSSHSDSSKHSRLTNNKIRERGRDSPGLKPKEKIKLRLTLEKSEPVSPAYKVDVSFINTQPKKASCVGVNSNEELRVPPLHISLRGRNHVVINNKKKIKFNSDGSPVKPKVRKVQDHPKPKKSDNPKEPVLNSEQINLTNNSVSVPMSTLINTDPMKSKSCVIEGKKLKKPKPSYEQVDQSVLTNIHLINQESDLSKHKLGIYNTHYKEKLKERRGSDSELAARSNKRFGDGNGLFQSDKKRRLSQTEQKDLEPQPSVLVGSTNIGTVTTLPTHKLRKDKIKVKEGFKNKEINRNKSYSKNVVEKLSKQIALPTGEIDMEAKFKQRLLEDPEKGVPRPPHRTEPVNQTPTENNVLDEADKVADLVQTLSDHPPVKDKPPEPDKCNTPDRKPDLTDKQSGRSPNSGAQGEDSGIESMDALSEKSPNQASQSPHADIPDSLKPKTQVPDILDIEAQLAKMEGLNGEDLNENKHNSQTKFDQCCGLTSALQDSLKQGTVTLTNHSGPPIKEQMPQVEVSLVPLKNNVKEEDLEPLPVRVTPPLYTYSNPEKSRGSDSPSLSDSDSNSCPTLLKSKSLLEQLLIEIPDHQNTTSPSPPAARSVRTRASSKLNSPELNSPVIPKQSRTGSIKRKRNESDSSNNSLEDVRNKKPRKCSENSSDLIKQCNRVVDPAKVNTKKNKVLEESSDSDEPLIEVAGKVRKNSNINTSKPKLKSTVTGGLVKNINTRRSVRTMPALNTRSKGDKILPDADMLRRKTRSAVSEVDAKRKKEVK